MSFIVAFTGHRPDKLGGYAVHNPMRDRLMVKLSLRLFQLRAEHPDLSCISGMALGFDQWAAGECVRLGIPFEAAVPFVGQESRWPAESQKRYHELLAKATTISVICEGDYAGWKMQRRNEWMVDHGNLLVAAWDRTPGGTANCVEYATKIGKPVENLL